MEQGGDLFMVSVGGCSVEHGMILASSARVDGLLGLRLFGLLGGRVVRTLIKKRKL